MLKISEVAVEGLLCSECGELIPAGTHMVFDDATFDRVHIKCWLEKEGYAFIEPLLRHMSDGQLVRLGLEVENEEPAPHQAVWQVGDVVKVVGGIKMGQTGTIASIRGRGGIRVEFPTGNHWNYVRTTRSLRLEPVVAEEAPPAFQVGDRVRVKADHQHAGMVGEITRIYTIDDLKIRDVHRVLFDGGGTHHFTTPWIHLEKIEDKLKILFDEMAQVVIRTAEIAERYDA